MATIYPSCVHPGRTSLADSTATGPTIADNGQAARARAWAPLELACQHVALRRRLTLGGTCRPVEVPAGLTRYWYFRLPREAWSGNIRVVVLATLTSPSSSYDATVSVATSADPTYVDEGIYPTLVTASRSAVLLEARRYEIDAQFGDELSTDFGDATVTVKAACVTGTLKIWAITLEPQPVEEITI